MADAYTSFFNLIKMDTNSHNNDWGTQLNNNFDIIDRLFRTRDHLVTGGTITLLEDDVLELSHRLSGPLLSNLIVNVPIDTQKSYFWKNDTTGNFTVTIKVIGQTGVQLAQGDTKFLTCNGVDVVDQGIPTYTQLAGLAEWLGSASGTNGYSLAANEFISSLSDGLEIAAYFPQANTTAVVTINFASTGAKTVVHNDGSALGVGDISTGSVKSFRYHLQSNKWFMSDVSPSTLAKASSINNWTAAQTFSNTVTFTRGVMEPPTVLTDAATILWNMALTSRNVTVTLGGAGRTLDTPSNANIGQWGSIEIAQDGTGGWPIALHANYDAMGATIALDKSASARNIFGYYCRSGSSIAIWPLYRSTRESISTYKEYDMGTVGLGSTKTQAHGLGKYPSAVQVYIEAITSDSGYAIGARIIIGDSKDADNDRGLQAAFDTTNVYVRQGDNEMFLMNTTGTHAAMIPSRWKVIARVYE